MKTLIKKTSELLGGHLYSDGSLPTGVNWLHDIRRAAALDAAPLCVDVGANVGQTVRQLRQAYAQAQIHAFEPFAGPRAQLEAATRGDTRVTVVPLAMGAAPGTLRVRPHAESQMSSLATQANAEDAAGQPAETVRIDTLDRYCALQGIAHIDILKTDTEGYDLEVLKGATGLLARQAVGYIYIEVGFLAHDRQHTPFSPVLDSLGAQGYRFLGLYETYPLHHFEETSVYCNALFVSARVRERALALRRAVR